MNKDSLSGKSPKTLRAAVNAFCKACLYDKNAGYGSWRQQVSNCRSFSCPLFNVRPGARSARGLPSNAQHAGNNARNDVFLADGEASHGGYHVEED